jgi:3-deoxy-D-manno-octulosonic-acid transferase
VIRLVYSILSYILTPILIIRLLVRALKSPGYAHRWAERFGFIESPDHNKIIWLHAVSVGETLAAIPLVKALQKDYPNYRIVITCMTVTGSERIRAVFGDAVDHSYVPYDTPGAVARFLRRVEPELLIIMETELWPNTIAACKKRHIPVVLANARLSQKSADAYKKILPLIRPMLQSVTDVVAQYPDDATRFVELGLPESALSISGNIKFDLTIDDQLRQQANQLAKTWRGSNQRPIWLAASTHHGEDEIVLQAFHRVIKSCEAPPLLVLVPRHPERFNQVYELCESQGFTVVRRSEPQSDIKKADILLGDTMGELMSFYGACDIAFVGGSLVPNGGHNMIEPATWGVPVLIGPHLYNFSEASRRLIDGNGMLVCNDADKLADDCVNLLNDPSQCRAMGVAAQQVAEANRGALGVLLNQIGKHLND